MPRRPITEYGRLKAMIEADLHDAHTRAGFPATVIHPGHISGRGWLPVDPQGTLDGTGVYSRLTHGEPVYLPDNGLATLHHVHADDVAQMFELAILNRGQSSGESFSSAAPAALTLLGCCNSVASLFGRDPNVEFVPLVELESIMSPGVYKETKTHVEHSPCASIQKAIERLGYRPRYTIPQIYRECVEEMIITGKLADKDFSGH